MAERLRIDRLCDVCLADDVETPGYTYAVDVTIAGEEASPRNPFVVELCPEHGAALADAVLALAPLGRTPELRRARSRRDQTSEPNACPRCGHVAPSLGALRAHLRTEHDTSLAGVGLAEARFKCETCGNPFENGQGLAAHVRSRHPGIWAARKQPA